MSPYRSPRSLIVLRGSPASTATQARWLLSNLTPSEVLWIGADAPSEFVACSPQETKKKLGLSFDTIVYDVHDLLDADVLGRVEGLIRRGGTLILRVGSEQEEELPRPGRADLALFPFSTSDVGRRFRQRVLRLALSSDALRESSTPLEPADLSVVGTAEQADVVASLTVHLLAEKPSLFVLIADRGRGKSSALGLALANVLEQRPGLRVAVCSAEPEGAREVLRFTKEGTSSARTPSELLFSLEREGPPDLILVDEAAQLSVSLLQQITRYAPQAHIAFATTCRGYEGTGRGFVLRFLRWIHSEGRDVFSYSLRTPIRFDEGDPLEQWVAKVLLLDTELQEKISSKVALRSPSCRRLEPEELAGDEQLLRQVFGLLVHAHYRTSPGDLERLLDAPNIAVHAMLEKDTVLAVTLVAREGRLATELCRHLQKGQERIRGQALPDTLLHHGGRLQAGELSYLRSVRVATHPLLRRKGLASELVEHIHDSYQVDAFGTMFGATLEVVRFRQGLGYQLVRLGMSRGARTGEPAVVMLRPVSLRAKETTAVFRRELARNLPWQIREFAAEGLPLSGELEQALLEGLDSPEPLSALEINTIVDEYLRSARPVDTIAYAISSFVQGNKKLLSYMDKRSSALLRARWIEGRIWREAAEVAGFKDTGAAMRAMRGAMGVLRRMV